MTEIAGRTAFITGAANGIGLGIARAFARQNVRLALVDIDALALDQAEAELSQLTQVATSVLDIRERDRFAALADMFEAKLGPISLVINNAGVAGGAPAARLTYELWDWNLGINLNGAINGVQTFLPRMAKRGGGGHFVNTASSAGLAASVSGVLYHTAKFAVVGLSEAMHQELQALGIGVSVLCPGPVATNIIARTREMQPSVVKQMSAREYAAAQERNTEFIQLLNAGVSPDEVGEMVLAAIRRDQLYIHTDRTMIPLIEARCKALLDAMPAA